MSGAGRGPRDRLAAQRALGPQQDLDQVATGVRDPGDVHEIALEPLSLLALRVRGRGHADPAVGSDALVGAELVVEPEQLERIGPLLDDRPVLVDDLEEPGHLELVILSLHHGPERLGAAPARLTDGVDVLADLRDAGQRCLAARAVGRGPGGGGKGGTGSQVLVEHVAQRA